MSFAKSKEGQILTNPLVSVNPVMVQTLGICSALAVTAQLQPSLVMSLSLTAVVTISNVVISLIRNMIPARIRIVVFMLVISTLVALTDQILKAYLFEVSKQLSVFVGLIITNCIVMGRAEAFATTNTPKMALLDGLGNGAGYSIVLCIVGLFRELLGSGKIFGVEVVPQALYDIGYVNNGLMVLAPGAFFLIAILIWISNTLYRSGK
jgi:Na+-transporting NADH:ubiquinone oxidoreductase subunit D